MKRKAVRWCLVQLEAGVATHCEGRVGLGFLRQVTSDAVCQDADVPRVCARSDCRGCEMARNCAYKVPEKHES